LKDFNKEKFLRSSNFLFFNIFSQFFTFPSFKKISQSMT
jgi:hypothetical protein